MKTTLEILTDPNPSERDTFIIATAKAIVLKYPRSAQNDLRCAARALAAACRYAVYDVPLSTQSFGMLLSKIVDVCAVIRTGL